MKTINLAVLALATLSTATFAGTNRNGDLRDLPTYRGKYSESTDVPVNTDVRALLAAKRASGATCFELMTETSIQNGQGRH